MAGTVMASRERGGRWLVWHGGAEGWGSAWASQCPLRCGSTCMTPILHPGPWGPHAAPGRGARPVGGAEEPSPASEARCRNWPRWLLQHRLQPACIGTARQQNPDCRAPRSFWARWAGQTAFLTSFPGSSWRSETGELLLSSVRSSETEPGPCCAGPWGRHPWLSGFC